MEARLPLVVIVGPTASGKTALAVELAKKFNGEIICADSRTIYKGMDIGTAKPTQDEMQDVPHWGLDLVEPGERFTVADFKQYANQKAKEIRRRGHTPFLVGGTGLYIDAVIFDYQFGGDVNYTLRTKLEKMTIEELHNYCNKNNIILPENDRNKRYVIRTIERNNISDKSRDEPISNLIIVGIATDKDELRTRIVARAEQLFENGVVQEATMLGKKYGWESEAMTGNIYPIIRLYSEDKVTFEETVANFVTADWRLAKRQLTWLRRNPFIKWHTLRGAKEYLLDELVKHV